MALQCRTDRVYHELGVLWEGEYVAAGLEPPVQRVHCFMHSWLTDSVLRVAARLAANSAAKSILQVPSRHFAQLGRRVS